MALSADGQRAGHAGYSPPPTRLTRQSTHEGSGVRARSSRSAQRHRRHGPQPRDGRPPRARRRGRRRRSSSCCRRSGRCSAAREDLRAGAEPLDGPALTLGARRPRASCGIDLVAGSIAERVAGRGEAAQHLRARRPGRRRPRDLPQAAPLRRRGRRRVYRESDHEAPGDEPVLTRRPRRRLGLAICYDLRFPELYRVLALRGARILTVPAPSRVPTTRDHWEVLVRARAIENQAFVVAANQIGEHAPGLRSGGRSLIVDPWGVVLAQRARRREPHRRRPRPRPPQDAIRARLPVAAPTRRPEAYALMATARTPRDAADKRRLILDAAVRVFARQGFHPCRVSDIADEAGVAYGLVYHYFRSKDEVLDTLFLERWNVLLDVIREVDARDLPAREKLHAIASFIIDCYRHDPDLMKVIIVEVTRAANSFGATHLDKIRRPTRSSRRSPRRPRPTASSRTTVTPAVRRDGLLRRDRAGADGLDLRRPAGRPRPTTSRPRRFIVETICSGLRAARADLSAPAARLDVPGAGRIGCRAMDNDLTKRLVWSGLLAGIGALASIATTRVAALVYRRVFGEDPPE